MSGPAASNPIEDVHFMVEGTGDCAANSMQFIDNIVVRRYHRHGHQTFCTAGNSRECTLRNPLVVGQEDGGTARSVPWDMCGTKSVRDTGATKESDCQGFCDAQVPVDRLMSDCMHALLETQTDLHACTASNSD